MDLKRIMMTSVWRIDYKEGLQWSKVMEQEATAILKLRNICKRCYNRGVEKHMLSAYTLKVKLMGIVAGNDVGHERKKAELKITPKFWT